MNHSDVAHYWANQVRHRGQGSNMFFEGNSIFSYGYHFKIAKIIKDVVLFNDEQYSMSTRQHQSIVRNAVLNKNIIYVNNPDASHQSHVEYFIDKLEQLRIDLVRSRKYKDSILVSIQRVVREVNLYFKTFKCKGKIKRSTLKRIKELTEGTFINEEIIAKVKAEEAIKRAKKLKENKEQIAKWKKGEGYTLHGINKIFLRVNGERVESSHGASATKKEARVLLKLIEAGKDIKGFKLGYYTVIGIENNILKIGCHRIDIKEIKRIRNELVN